MYYPYSLSSLVKCLSSESLSNMDLSPKILTQPSLPWLTKNSNVYIRLCPLAWYKQSACPILRTKLQILVQTFRLTSVCLSPIMDLCGITWFLVPSLFGTQPGDFVSLLTQLHPHRVKSLPVPDSVFFPPKKWTFRNLSDSKHHIDDTFTLNIHSEQVLFLNGSISKSLNPKL